MDATRANARRLAEQHLKQGDALGWFEALYVAAESQPKAIPWADMAPNPNLIAWLQREDIDGHGQRALVVGCGLGDDAEALAAAGFAVTAFDVSPTAIAWCGRRFPESKVSYHVADLFALDPTWQRRFDLVLEVYTLQVLPPALRDKAMAAMASCVAPRGRLLVVCRGRDETDDPGAMPWPLTRRQLDGFTTLGFTEVSFEDYMDDEDPPVRRFRAVYQRLDVASSPTATKEGA